MLPYTEILINFFLSIHNIKYLMYLNLVCKLDQVCASVKSQIVQFFFYFLPVLYIILCIIFHLFFKLNSTM